MTQMQAAILSEANAAPTRPPLKPPGECVDWGAINAILSASHGDPFAVLGPHEVAAGIWDIRVFQPGAERIDLVEFYELGGLGSFEQIHPDGFFVARLHAPHRPGYRLKIKDAGGERLVNDPYLFGSSLNPDDIAAISHSNDTAFYFIFGAHPIVLGGVFGMRFVVWAPSATNVSVVGEFNFWDGRRHPMRALGDVGCWELFIPELGKGARYKFEIKGPGARSSL